MSGQKLTLVVAFPEGAPLPRFSFNTPCLGGTVKAFQIGDALAELEAAQAEVMPPPLCVASGVPPFVTSTTRHQEVKP